MIETTEDVEADRVITEEAVKQVERNDVLVALLTNDENTDYSKSILLPEGPVLVYNDQAELIGSVNLVFVTLAYKPGSFEIMGDFRINGNSPEGFDLEQDVRKFYPQLQATMEAVELDIGTTIIQTINAHTVVLATEGDGEPM